MVVLSPNAEAIMHRRFLREGEDETKRFVEIAMAIAAAEGDDQHQWATLFYEELLSPLYFIPNSPTIENAGRGAGSLSACFVIPSAADSMEAIFDMVKEWGMTEKWGGGIGASFSNIRPKNSPIRTTHKNALGPLGVIRILAAMSQEVTQGSFRDGAHMAMLDVWHPDILDFIHAKDHDDTLENFNISVKLSDEFMRAVEDDKDWRLYHPSVPEFERFVKARDIWNEICESAHKTGDPGIVFIDRVLETQPNPSLGDIQSSNPCGEQFLEDYGNCCLGSIDVSKFYLANGVDRINWNHLEEVVNLSVRFLDDVIEMNTFPLEKLREVNLSTRRIGLGVMGWADLLVLLGIRYDSDEALSLAKKLGKFINEKAWAYSEKLAEERGAFPLWEESALKAEGRKPSRHSSVTNVAPTGTISRLANCSSGIEPHFAMAWWSNIMWEDGAATVTHLDAPRPVREALSKEIGVERANELLESIAHDPHSWKAVLAQAGMNTSALRTAHEIPPEWHVKMQAAWQENVSNSLSKSINLPNSASVEVVKAAYMQAYQTKTIKATTVYRDGSKGQQVLNAGGKKEVEAPDAKKIAERPRDLNGIQTYANTGQGKLWVNTTFMDGKPFEVFATVSKSGDDNHAYVEAISRLASNGLRFGMPVEDIINSLAGITSHPAYDNGELFLSVPDALAKILRRVTGQVGATKQLHALDIRNAPKDPSVMVVAGALCPVDSAPLRYVEGCAECTLCGWSKCG